MEAVNNGGSQSNGSSKQWRYSTMEAVDNEDSQQWRESSRWPLSSRPYTENDCRLICLLDTLKIHSISFSVYKLFSCLSPLFLSLFPYLSLFLYLYLCVCLSFGLNVSLSLSL